MTDQNARDPLLSAIHDAWTRWDPPPPDLADTILIGLARADLDADYELLTLVNRHDHLAGTRSAPTDAHRVLIEFRSGELTVLVRVSQDAASGAHRLDGWVTPASGGEVTVVQGERATTVALDENGRFAVPTAGPGLAQLIVRPVTDAADGELRTTLFEI